ncbi:MAG: PAS domain-containing protein [Phycisphaerales bacterium]|nr:PAS domain-containing protein [Phycisphaerales bacterium]
MSKDNPSHDSGRENHDTQASANETNASSGAANQQGKKQKALRRAHTAADVRANEKKLAQAAETGSVANDEHDTGTQCDDSPMPVTPSVAALQAVSGTDTPYIVCLGASAGGLEALEAFFAALPADTGAAFVTVVHLSPDFKSLMPELLQRHTTMRIAAAQHGTVPRANTIYIIPPGKNMVFNNGRLCLEDQDRTPGHALNLPIDIFLKSLADGPGERTIAVILSGTGSDGSRGIRVLKDAGGIVLVQDPETAKFDGMPRSAMDTGLVDSSASPASLAKVVADIVQQSRDHALHQEPEAEGESIDDMTSVLDVLRSHFNLDLAYLRPSMLQRRVRRRMALLGLPGIPEYVERLVRDVNEARALRQDTFIGVTGFFRDREAFDRLQRHLASELLPRLPDDQFRIWVPACATGEEVYSLAILALEAMEASAVKREMKIFATDIDEDSLNRASKATYPTAGIAEIGPARLSKYFMHNGDSVVIKPQIREMVICAQHNLVTDPPFTRIDLVSCRNFLIYLEQPAQENVLASLHFALRAGGTLFLGSAEAMGRLSSEFETIDAKYKLFRKARNVILPSMRRRAGMRDPIVASNRSHSPAHDRERDASIRQVIDALVERDGKSAALVAMDGTVIELLGDPVGVFQLPKGKLSTDIMRMVGDELTAALTTGLQRVRRGDTNVRYSVDLAGETTRHVSVKLTRLPAFESIPDRVLIVVEPGRNDAISGKLEQASLDKDTSQRMHEMQLELQQTRESLQATIEELQSSNEEQQSTNEELVASNEELQSTNEELQSVNEELYTVNVEYQNKIQELAVLAADLDNLLRNIDIGTLFLDSELRIRKFTPAIEQVIKLLEHDVGRSIEHFSHNLGSEFLADVNRVIKSGDLVEREVRGVRGNWLLVRILPYMAHSGQQSGVVVTFIDITPIKNAQEMTRMANEQLAFANKELSRQREELEDLFSIVAHDLKRPVVALDGLLKLIKTGDAKSGESSDAELLAKAIEECQRMKRMLVDLAHVSGVTRREPTKDDVVLQDWLDALVDRFRQDAETKNVRINCTCDAGKVRIGRAFVEEAFINLMENALKYGTTKPNPRIDVSCTLSENALELSVRDNGKGIAQENHQKIFEPFRRLDPGLADGSGIGLVAARRLIARNGGTLSVQSVPGEGAKFTARIPIESENAQSRLEARKPRVLLVEDDSLDAKIVERFLGDSFATTRVKDIAEAEARLTNDFYDLVLLDLSLPDGHGFQLVQRMRTSLGVHIPVVVVTGHGEGLAPMSMSATIAGYVSKMNLQKDTLLNTIASAMDQAKTPSASPSA